ncbi:MAG: hypothetical protein WCK49_10495 [Myxococcaceae bacterium]
MDVTDVLVDELNKKVEQLKEWIASGQAQEYPSYQKTCGEIRGLLIARGYILDLKQKLENSDNE